MNPEDIASHEPTAVKRDQDTDIAQEGQTVQILLKRAKNIKK
jgi:hypothetical protein